MAEDAMARGAADSLGSAVSGDLDRAVPFPLAFKKGEAERLMPGVVDREGGLLGRLMVGLSQDEKKSSSPSPAGVLEPLAARSSAVSVTTTSSGYLTQPHQCCLALLLVGVHSLFRICGSPPL